MAREPVRIPTRANYAIYKEQKQDTIAGIPIHLCVVQLLLQLYYFLLYSGRMELLALANHCTIHTPTIHIYPPINFQTFLHPPLYIP